MGVGLKTALAATLKSKTAAVVLAAVLATGGATGAAAAANQGVFGQQVKSQVATCKAHLAQGIHGIGECVSDFAQRHGAQQRQQHSQDSHGKSGAPHGAPNSHSGGPPTRAPGASHGQGHGKP